MKPGSWPPWITSNSSSIQSMCCGVVMTSGAGTSTTAPTLRETCRTHPRQICSCSRALRLCGSQTTPPLAPPSGMSTTEHFQVIHIARARTVSTVSCGMEADPPLGGAAGIVVLDAETAEDLHAAVVHPHRDAEVELAQRPPEEVARGAVERQDVRRLVELRLRHLERIERAFHREGPLFPASSRPGPGGPAAARESASFPSILRGISRSLRRSEHAPEPPVRLLEYSRGSRTSLMRLNYAAAGFDRYRGGDGSME